MILHIQNSRSFKGICMLLALTIFCEIVIPTQAWALTGGPAQPEFSSFTPIGTSDMVDLSSGDMSYNIPLMDVGGYPINLAYASGIGMDEEASWTGLGWNVSVGQINRNVRGIPDDFKGDELLYENHMKENITAGGSIKVQPAAFGIEIGEASIGFGIAANYNNYSGFSMAPSVGANIEIGNNVSIGFNVQSTSEGMCISPSLSLGGKMNSKSSYLNSMSASVGTSFNSRQGLSGLTMGASRKLNYSRTEIKKGSTTESITYQTSYTGSVGSSISFTDEIYTPTKRVGMQTQSFTFNGAVGGEVWGVEGQVQVNAYGTITNVRADEKSKLVKAYGYQHTDKGNDFSVLDFNREKDGPFSVNMTNLAVTNYTYDIYSVQGQGVGGMYRPYRNQVGYVYDPRVDDISVSSTLGIELGAGNAVHVGVDVESVVVNAHSGIWRNQNSILSKLTESYGYDPNYEKVHYKCVGDKSVDDDFYRTPASLNDGMFEQVGNYSAVNIPIGGFKFFRNLKSQYSIKNQAGTYPSSVNSANRRTKRQLRNQAIYNLTLRDVLDKKGYGPLNHSGSGYVLPSGAKNHHNVETQIIRNDGARYVYGLPAYNTKKVEASFATGTSSDCVNGLVNYNPNDLINSDGFSNLPNDQFVNRVTTPAFVHTNLLTSILSTDYQDRTGDGPTNDDLGSYTKFFYEKKNSSYKWRVPYQKNKASYNAGLNTESTDDQGNIVYGEKELYYIKKIETKTHVAIFETSPRLDAQGVDGIDGNLENSATDSKMYKLDAIKLYSVGEYYTLSGTLATNPTPIKVVHFVYNYDLCKNVPNNYLSGTMTPNEMSNAGGKLTLQKVYFTYRNSKMGKYTPYQFYYDQENPDYNLKAYDSWGNYSPNPAQSCSNTDNPTALEFPYTNQNTAVQDVRSSVWLLRKISLPSGGEISVNYESDRYAYVQDTPVMRMFKIMGAGSTGNVNTDMNNDDCAQLFTTGMNKVHAKYIYAQIEDDPSVSAEDYLPNLSLPIQFRFYLNMTKLGGLAGNDNTAYFDYVSGYFQADGLPNFETFGGAKFLRIPVKQVQLRDIGAADRNPFSKAGWHFGRKYLSKHVYSLEDNGEQSSTAGAQMTQIIQDLFGPTIIQNLKETFAGPNRVLEDNNIARRFVKTKSWVRLFEADGEKLGGGSRVVTVKMTDKWADNMITSNPSLYETMTYGQKYNYDLSNGKTSGVATYEPVGNKENPLVQPYSHDVKKLLAPNEHNYVEGPFGESFYPNPQVTYARVTVSNIRGGTLPEEVKALHRTGKVVSEFYTTKDYPVIIDQTTLDPIKDNSNSFASLLKLSAQKHVYGTQGYLIHLNDMNGKQKAQWVYAEGQAQPISGVEYKYDNHASTPGNSPALHQEINRGKLDNRVPVIRPDGTLSYETIGVEMDVIHDFRENKTNTDVLSVNTNLAAFLVGIIPALTPIPLPDISHSEDQMRTSSSTKVINTFGILKETVAHDAGAKVYTRNLAWDASTGEVLVTETIDEFDDKYYTLNYPAHWNYRGMGQASRNLGLTGSLSVTGGAYTLTGLSGASVDSYVVEGDEMMVYSSSNSIPERMWVVDLTSGSSGTFKLMNKNGVNINSFATGSHFEIVRSGHRNLQSAGIMNVTLMKNPIVDNQNNLLASINSNYLMASLGTSEWANWKIINAGAVDYSDHWSPGCECGIVNNQFGTSHNPYVVNEKGVWRTKSSRTYLVGRNYNSSPTPRADGFFLGFSPMYKYDGTHWQKDFNGWTFVAEVTRFSPYGFELENKDALNRYSAAQYGYNNMFPIAVGANSEYREIGFDGFEDYNYKGCAENEHFKFNQNSSSGNDQNYSVVNEASHTGKHSIKVGANSRATMSRKLNCEK